MRVQSLGQEDLLEEEIATGSSILAWRIPWTRGASQVVVYRVLRVGHDLATAPPPCTDMSWTIKKAERL